MFNYILYRIGRFIALNLPLRFAYGVGVFVSDVHGLFSRDDRACAYANLQTIFPGKSDREIKSIRRRLFRNFAKYLVDFFRFDHINRQYVDSFVKLHNMRYFDEALARGKGVIALTAHLGNWELGGVSAAIVGYPLWGVALPHKNRKVDAFFNAQRESKGLQVIPLGRAVRACLRLLSENKIIALVGDRDFTERGIALELFGKPMIFPEGPAALAVKTGATVIPGFMVRNPDDTFSLYMETPIIPEPSGNPEADVRAMIIKYKAVFERYIRAYPDQWYQFKKYWIK